MKDKSKFSMYQLANYDLDNLLIYTRKFCLLIFNGVNADHEYNVQNRKLRFIYLLLIGQFIMKFCHFNPCFRSLQGSSSFQYLGRYSNSDCKSN